METVLVLVRVAVPWKGYNTAGTRPGRVQSESLRAGSAAGLSWLWQIRTHSTFFGTCGMQQHNHVITPHSPPDASTCCAQLCEGAPCMLRFRCRSQPVLRAPVAWTLCMPLATARSGPLPP